MTVLIKDNNKIDGKIPNTNTSNLDSRDALGASLDGGDVGGDPGGRAGGHGELPELRLVHLRIFL